MTVIKPQNGPQESFLSSPADIVIYGGSAGGGKSFGLLLDPLRNIGVKDFGAVTFRKTSVQVRNEGALWDTSMSIYPHAGGRPRENSLEWRFPSGASISFSHLERMSDAMNWQGAQIASLNFDELTHFDERVFWYMMSRNRTTSGVKPTIKATTNPDPDSWVRKLIDWWIDKEGYPIPERSGALRYFVRIDDTLHWDSEPITLVHKFGAHVHPKSLTFIPAKLEDNQILVQKDPGYYANLMALPYVDRMRLLFGNWNIRESAGLIFNRSWFNVVDAIPSGWTHQIRHWDVAATSPSSKNPDPDWTRGLKLYKYPNGRFLVADLRSLRGSPYEVENLIKTTASHDGFECKVTGEEDPGAAGKSAAHRFITMLSGYNVGLIRPSKDKVTRAKPVSAQCEARNFDVLRGTWNDEFFKELEAFPDGPHDDIVDSLSGAYNQLSESAGSLLDVL